MTVLLLLIPLSLLLLACMIGAFIWAVRNGQFEDLDTPPLEMLIEHSEVAIERTARAEMSGDER
ncbi:MAG TPA: cbb3-type cytochrome oxidase assembly protein CcoS [Steroidobacteraceae bacterium]|nr:cbb3-type cytochrome oxidase assembly protein CcoS [Steroidobacteraceae bacterium]